MISAQQSPNIQIPSQRLAQLAPGGNYPQRFGNNQIPLGGGQVQPQLGQPQQYMQQRFGSQPTQPAIGQLAPSQPYSGMSNQVNYNQLASSPFGADRNLAKLAQQSFGTPKTQQASPRTFKKGGMVKKTGMALVHKGEKVLTKKQMMAKKMKSKDEN